MGTVFSYPPNITSETLQSVSPPQTNHLRSVWFLFIRFFTVRDTFRRWRSGMLRPGAAARDPSAVAGGSVIPAPTPAHPTHRRAHGTEHITEGKGCFSRSVASPSPVARWGEWLGEGLGPGTPPPNPSLDLFWVPTKVDTIVEKKHFCIFLLDPFLGGFHCAPPLPPRGTPGSGFMGRTPTPPSELQGFKNSLQTPPPI